MNIFLTIIIIDIKFIILHIWKRHKYLGRQKIERIIEKKDKREIDIKKIMVKIQLERFKNVDKN